MKTLKIVFLALLAVLAMSFASMADTASSFPFELSLSMEKADKLCYAGHIPGGGMFYDDGLMVTPNVSFTVVDRLSDGSDKYEDLSMEVDLIYENSDNTQVVKEVLKKYEAGDITPGKEYELFSETAQKSLKQRKKLYSSDIMSVKVVLTYESEAGLQKKQVSLFYIAKEAEYNEKLVSLQAPPQ